MFSKWIILLPIIFLISTNAYAYKFTEDVEKGFYWASFPIHFKKFVVDASDGPLLERIVDESTEEWESAVGVEIWSGDGEVAIVSQAYSGNFIRWSNNFGDETGYDPSTTLAIATRYTVGTNITRTEIILNGSLAHLRSNEGGILKKTILHELGHTIGLDHTTENAVMYPYVGAVEKLQEDDIKGASAVMAEMKYRQSIGYVSQYADDKESNASKFASCATVDLVGGGGGGNSAGVSFLLSLLIGVILVKLLGMISWGNHSPCF